MEATAGTPVIHTLAEAAAILKVKESWLQRKAAKREIPFTMPARTYLFTSEHLAEIIRLYENRPGEKPQQPERARRPRRSVETPAPVTVLRPRPRKITPRKAA